MNDCTNAPVRDGVVIFASFQEGQEARRLAGLYASQGARYLRVLSPDVPAATLLREAFENTHLVFLGEGQEELIALLASAGLRDRTVAGTAPELHRLTGCFRVGVEYIMANYPMALRA